LNSPNIGVDLIGSSITNLGVGRDQILWDRMWNGSSRPLLEVSQNEAADEELTDKMW